MAKMFYRTEEAAQKLGISPDQIKQLVSENKLREFRDGAHIMFKVDQVDKLAQERKGGTAGGTKAGSSMGLGGSSIGLAGDSHASDVISLADSSLSPAKDDTVVTGGSRAGSKGGSKTGAAQVFKPGEVKSADTGAQTHIQGAIDDQLALEGVGSGSGLLDLTRESDDTSLGAELLDEIYPGGDTKGESGIGSASGIFVESAGGSSVAAAQQGSADISPPVAGSSAPVVVADIGGEPYDGTSGLFGGVALASAFISIATAVIALCFYNGFSPDWVRMITQSDMYVGIFALVLIVLTVLFAGIGMVVFKPSR
jgi:excisionase family DNA binding protein